MRNARAALQLDQTIVYDPATNMLVNSPAACAETDV